MAHKKSGGYAGYDSAADYWYGVVGIVAVVAFIVWAAGRDRLS